MEKKYDSGMLRQLRGVVKSFDEFFDSVSFDYIASCVPAEAARKIKRVVITGCGDSYCAAIAARPVFEICGGVRADALRNIEASRYFAAYSPLSTEEAAGCCAMAISVSGMPVRPREALQRMKKMGCITVAFTDNPDSPLAGSADYVVGMKVPRFEMGPLVVPYMASQFAAMMLALYIGTANGSISMDEAVRRREALKSYVSSFTGELLPDMESRVSALCEGWLRAGVNYYDYVGDGADYATAFFGSAKQVESTGELTTNDDAEDWCHINFFNCAPKTTASFVVANPRSPSFSRALEVVRTMLAMKRPVIVITDGDASAFPEGAEVFALPKAPESWMNPMMQHLPMDFAAAILGVLLERGAYRSDVPAQTEDRAVQKNPAITGRFRESRLEIAPWA